MSERKEVVIIGYSGHGYVLGEAALQCNYNLKFYAERREVVRNPYHLSYLGNENDLDFEGWRRGYEFIIGIGDNRIRENIALKLVEKGEILKTVIHPSARIATTANIKTGVFISQMAAVNPLVTVGFNSILNTGCIVEHECRIGSSSHIAPGAVLAGNVTIGERTFVGANSVIKQGVLIGKNVTIGAGAVVLKNIPDNEVWVGNPARRLR